MISAYDQILKKLKPSPIRFEPIPFRWQKPETLNGGVQDTLEWVQKLAEIYGPAEVYYQTYSALAYAALPLLNNIPEQFESIRTTLEEALNSGLYSQEVPKNTLKGILKSLSEEVFEDDDDEFYDDDSAIYEVEDFARLVRNLIYMVYLRNYDRGAERYWYGRNPWYRLEGDMWWLWDAGDWQRFLGMMEIKLPLRTHLDRHETPLIYPLNEKAEPYFNHSDYMGCLQWYELKNWQLDNATRLALQMACKEVVKKTQAGRDLSPLLMIQEWATDPTGDANRSKKKAWNPKLPNYIAELSKGSSPWVRKFAQVLSGSVRYLENRRGQPDWKDVNRSPSLYEAYKGKVNHYTKHCFAEQVWGCLQIVAACRASSPAVQKYLLVLGPQIYHYRCHRKTSEKGGELVMQAAKEWWAHAKRLI